MASDVVFFVVGIVFVVLGTLAVSTGEKGGGFLGIVLIVYGIGVVLVQGADLGEGRADSLKDLPSGTYVVQGEINTGSWRALWLAPLDSASGRLYELPKELVPTNFGHYVQKKEDELKPFMFEVK